MAFDRDAAGIGAAGRGIDMALSEDLTVKIAVIPSGKDPADAVKENPESWQKAVENAEDVIKFYLDLSNSVEDARKLVLPYISVLPNEMSKAKWVKEMTENGLYSKKFNLKEETVWEELKKVRLEQIRQSLGKKTETGKMTTRSTKTRLDILREQLLGVILWQKSGKDKELGDFIEKMLKEKDVDFSSMEAGISEADKEKMIFGMELFYSGSSPEFLKEEFETMIVDFKKETLKSKLIEMTGKMKEFEKSGDRPAAEKYLNEFYQMTKQLNELNNVGSAPPLKKGG